MAVNIRFVLTGSCHPYSGRQVLFALPLQQQQHSVEQGSAPTKISDVKAIIRKCWPSAELPAVAKSIASIGLKILKNGKLLNDDTILQEALTQQEIAESATQAQTSGSGFDDSNQSVSRTVLMHLVFHAPPAEPPVTARSATPAERKSSSAGDDGCGCSVM